MQEVNVDNLTEKLESAKNENQNLSNTIRSQSVIGNLEDFVAEELTESFDVDKEFIHTNEKIYGKNKTKNQDVVIHDSGENIRESYHSTGSRAQYIDTLGPLMVISVRSQIKGDLYRNYDTLCERLAAEPLNVHGRYPLVPFGWIYLLPARLYKPEDNTVAFEKHDEIERYLTVRQVLERRKEYSDPIDLPEAFNLLVVDFQGEVEILDKASKLEGSDLISEDFANKYEEEINNALSINNLFQTLICQFEKRYPMIYDSLYE